MTRWILLTCIQSVLSNKNTTGHQKELCSNVLIKVMPTAPQNRIRNATRYFLTRPVYIDSEISSAGYVSFCLNSCCTCATEVSHQRQTATMMNTIRKSEAVNSSIWLHSWALLPSAITLIHT